MSHILNFRVPLLHIYKGTMICVLPRIVPLQNIICYLPSLLFWLLLNHLPHPLHPPQPSIYWAYMSTTLQMSTNSISHTDPSPSSYTPPKTSRFLACGKLNPKYPEGLGKSVPSTFSGWPKFTREVPQPTLSPLASLSLPHTASGSYASESTLGSVENSPLQPKSSLLVHQKKLVVDERATQYI